MAVSARASKATHSSRPLMFVERTSTRNLATFPSRLQKSSLSTMGRLREFCARYASFREQNKGRVSLFKYGDFSDDEALTGVLASNIADFFRLVCPAIQILHPVHPWPPSSKLSRIAPAYISNTHISPRPSTEYISTPSSLSQNVRRRSTFSHGPASCTLLRHMQVRHVR